MGDYLQVYPQLEKLISAISRDYAGQSTEIELILVLHGDHWLMALPFYSFDAGGVTVTSIAHGEELPAVLFNHGSLAAHGRFLAFGWPGVDLSAWLSWLRRMTGELASKPEAAFLAGRPTSCSMRDDPLQSWKCADSDGVPARYDGGWLEMLDYVPMTGSLVSRAHFAALGGFSCSPLLQRGFWWEFTVRTTRTESITLLDSLSPDGLWSASTFPLANDLSLSGDLIARRVVRYSASPRHLMESCDWSDVQAFAVDLPLHTRRWLQRLLQDWSPRCCESLFTSCAGAHNSPATKPSAPLRVVVLGGLNEPAHNQLAFFNYFALLEGQGILTWRTILDTIAHPADITKADLVIFSRTKSEQARRLIDCCNALGIPAIYMLDDNWFSVGEDWPEYSRIFTPGAEIYENFMYCLVRADHVLTYNTILAEDLRRYSRHVDLLPVNVSLSIFPETNRRAGRRARVGYAGSFRRDESAFTALSGLAAEREDFDVLVMGTPIPDSLRSLSGHRLMHRDYIFGYRRYAAALCEAMPDILLAPLSNTRTDSSKCPNKYLEITAAGAVGVYSNTAPYDHFVANGQTGLLVNNDSASWKSAIEFLLDNPTARSAMLANAQRDVRLHFDTPSVLPAFVEFLMRVSGTEAQEASITS